MSNLNNLTKKIIMLGCQYSLSDKHLKEFTSLIPLIKDWQKLYQILTRTQTALFFYKNLLDTNRKNDVPLFFIKKLKKEYVKNCIRNAKKRHDYIILKTALESKGVKIIPLKGIYLNQFVYKDSGVRPMSDIDVLLKKEDIEKVKEIILSIGWDVKVAVYKSRSLEKISKDTHHHLNAITTGITIIEPHLGIHSLLNAYNVNINDYWNRSITVGETTFVSSYLNKTDFLQHLCLHAFSDLKNSVLKLRNFVDIIEFVKKNNNEIDWELLLKTSYKYKCLIEVRHVLKICIKYFNLQIDHEIKAWKEGKDVDFDIERLFLNMIIPNYYSKIIFINYKIKARLACYKKTKNVKEIIDLTLGFVFPSPVYIYTQFNEQNKSKLTYKYYKLLKLIK